MGNPKRHRLNCDKCGAPSQGENDMSCIGSCMDCAEYDFTDNILGLMEKGSVPYKRWRVAYLMSHPGRPKYTTPPPAWIPNMSSLQMRSVIKGKISPAGME